MPIGVIAAVTNTTLGLNVITEMIAGYLFPGRPIANIVFKVSLSTRPIADGALKFFHRAGLWLHDTRAKYRLDIRHEAGTVSDVTLSLPMQELTPCWLSRRYCKIPPRHLFICQVYGTALGSIVNYSLIKSVIASKRPYLDGTLIDATQQWSGRKPEIFMSASVVWGLIAPERFFAGMYRPLYWVRSAVAMCGPIRSQLTDAAWPRAQGFLLGALLPVIPWYLYKRTGNRFWRQISVPLILHGVSRAVGDPSTAADHLSLIQQSISPPQTPTNVLIPSFLASFASQFWALRYHARWFEKYCYVLSSALDAGTSINALVIYLFSLSFVSMSCAFGC